MTGKAVSRDGGRADRWCVGKSPGEIQIVPYRAEYGLEVVKMMRESFQQAMSLKRHDEFDDLSKHLDFFSGYDPGDVRVAIDTRSSTIVGCMVLRDREIEQLYVRVGYQRKGIGSRFLEMARTRFPDRLELFTFQGNTQAQAFYRKWGFREKARGQASREGNSWATSSEQLADIRFVWSSA